MRRKQTRTASNKQSPCLQRNVMIERARQQHSFMMFLCYLRRCPKIVQEVFAPYVKHMAYLYSSGPITNSIIDRVRPNVRARGNLDQQHILLFQNFSSLVELEEIAVKMIAMRPQIAKEMTRNSQQDISNYNHSPKINLVRPKYCLTERSAKVEGQLDIGMRTQHLVDQTSPLYNQPRFYDKLNELFHLCNNKKLRDCVLLLHHHGHAITGGRTYAALNGGNVEIWAKSSHIFPFPFNQVNQESEDSSENEMIKSESLHEPAFAMEHRFLAHRDKVTCASFSSDEFYLITGGVDRKIRLWCLRLRTLLAEFSCHSKVIWDVQFNPSGYYFLSGSGDGLMALWNTANDTPSRLFLHGADVYKVSFAPNPSFAISAGQDGRVKIWQVIEAQIKHCIELNNPVVNISTGRSGIYLLAIEADGRVTIFNLLQGQVSTSFYFYSQSKANGEKIVPIHDATFSQDQRDIACITKHHILLYSMDVLESQRKVNVFKQDKKDSHLRNAIPREILMIPSQQRLTFCGFRDFRLLVVGSTMII